MKGGSAWKMEGNGQLKKKMMYSKGEEVLAGLRRDRTESSELYVPD